MSGSTGRSTPRSHSPTTVTPVAARRFVSLIVRPASGVCCAGNSAISRSRYRPITWARNIPALTRFASCSPNCFFRGKTYVAPVSSRLSTASSSFAIAATGTSGATSRTVSVAFVFVVSSPFASTSAASFTRTASYVARESTLPNTTGTPSAYSRRAVSGSPSRT